MFPNNVDLNNDCRTFCWGRTDSAVSCSFEASVLIHNRLEYEQAQRHHQLMIVLVVAAVLALAALLLIGRTRRAFARGVYAVTGYDLRKVTKRWDGYR